LIVAAGRAGKTVIPGAYSEDDELLADDPEGRITALRLGLLFCSDDRVRAYAVP
jgi:hypothetical protein